MYPIVENNPALLPFSGDIDLRMERYRQKTSQLLKEADSLIDFANAHLYYGIRETADGWVYREWAPAADGVYLEGDFNDWNKTSHPLTPLAGGNWEITLPREALRHGSLVKTVVRNGDVLTEHIPLYAHRVVQDQETFSWACQVWAPQEQFKWTDQNTHLDSPLYIYEAHVGMATEEYQVGTYREFADQVLPHIQKSGYNTIQLMAIMEHPYYGSFGYQVSNFFAASSRLGTPEDLKYLVNTAHNMGIRVLLDLVHSHAVKNTAEGINRFDGTSYQFFHEGPRGEHPSWGTMCFNYDKPEVLHFLLSNLKYWMTEYHFDGFRFDGVTSMLYHHHGLGVDFDDMKKYFSMDTDLESITYLQLANKLIREINPQAITIAEDMSGMPGMCCPIQDGGIGFDYRLAMGIPDLWIKLIKEYRDEDWNIETIWKELCFRTEPTIAYAESHDQALVGDQTIMFRLAGANMYTDMDKACHNLVIDRAVALHKLIRLLTMAAGGNGYLCFMGNEFGHPEWIDFPREGNGWSYDYCRRQWSLLHNGFLKYQQLYAFDRDMIAAAKEYGILSQPFAHQRWIHVDDHVVAFERGNLLFVFNFHPTKSFYGYTIPVSSPTDYQVVFTSDDFCYGGQGRIEHMAYSAYVPGLEGNHLRLFLPSRTAMVLRPNKEHQKK